MEEEKVTSIGVGHLTETGVRADIISSTSDAPLRCIQANGGSVIETSVTPCKSRWASLLPVANAMDDRERQSLYEADARLVIIWDGASYHCSTGSDQIFVLVRARRSRIPLLKDATGTVALRDTKF